MKYFLLMAFVLVCDVTVGKYRFRQVNEVVTRKSWRELGDTATIKLPALKRRLQEVIKPGDAVTVKLSYNGLAVHTEFEGYVRRVLPNIPFELECEDHIYFLKKTPVKKSWAETTLEEVVKYLVAEVNTKHPLAGIKLSENLPEVNLKPFVIEAGNTAASVLQKLKESYGLANYFKGRELFVGLAYQKTYGTVKHSLAWNIIEHDLTYRNEEDVLLKIKAIGITKDNKKVEPKQLIGDADGEQRTLYFYNVTDEEQLKKLAEKELTKFKYTGFEGSFTTFLYPYAEPLMQTKLTDPQYDEKRSGLYVIDSVETTFGTNGARRVIEPGIILNPQTVA